jgi:hypothetical protein
MLGFKSNGQETPFMSFSYLANKFFLSLLV